MLKVENCFNFYSSKVIRETPVLSSDVNTAKDSGLHPPIICLFLLLDFLLLVVAPSSLLMLVYRKIYRLTLLPHRHRCYNITLTDRMILPCLI